jgi:hypothetical protein
MNERAGVLSGPFRVGSFIILGSGARGGGEVNGFSVFFTGNATGPTALPSRVNLHTRSRHHIYPFFFFFTFL